LLLVAWREKMLVSPWTSKSPWPNISHRVSVNWVSLLRLACWAEYQMVFLPLDELRQSRSSSPSPSKSPAPATCQSVPTLLVGSVVPRSPERHIRLAPVTVLRQYRSPTPSPTRSAISASVQATLVS